MANHRATGRANVRKSRVTGGTHRDSTLTAGVVKVGVLGALATATIAAPLAAAAAGVDESQAVAEVATPASDAVPALAESATAPVALPVADVASATATRGGDAADRSQERTSTDSADVADDAAAVDPATASTGIEVEAPAPEIVDEATGEELTASAEGFIRPVSGPITSGYGYRIHPVLGYGKGHDGVDFGSACGTPVHASAAGTVVAVENHPASGNRVKIDHGDGVVTGYYHLQGFNTEVGAKVEQGDVIGYVGSTGRSTGCHLHFAKMDESGTYSDPMALLK
ncbi:MULTISPECIES: M23 family metallopeptidase [Brachybacterium]|uniref:M23 family metallopeptidase n=1 Tax=Brachybacterium rhamnosum TaxID=173361 RepID=A0ABW4Q190_9MICO|nr:M23 family metallopeptidase [Brachybacterium squillarum]MCW1806503.1 M23 family metallopeptidase [Brachybacterium squillarum]